MELQRQSTLFLGAYYRMRDERVEPAPNGVPRAGVRFEIDANGILNALARAVQEVLALEDPRVRTSDPTWLKAANEAPDVATKLMAEAMMDKPVEALLRQGGAIRQESAVDGL